MWGCGGRDHRQGIRQVIIVRDSEGFVKVLAIGKRGGDK